MPLHSPSQRARRRHDQRNRHRPGAPAEAVRGHGGGEALLLVELAQCCLGRRQVSFHLDNEQRTARDVERKDVVRTPLAVPGIGHLDLDQPSKAAKSVRDESDEQRVTFVGHAIKSRAAPAQLDEDRGVQRAEDPAQGPQGNPIHVAALQKGHQVLRAAGSHRQIRLAPAAAAPERAHDAAHTLVVHAAIVKCAA